MDKVFYNEASASRLGWKPDWFGGSDFDEQLVELIKKWQRRHKIKVDGLCGPSTYRRIRTERESNISKYEPTPVKDKEKSHIVYKGNFFEINWPKVVFHNGLFE